MAGVVLEFGGDDAKLLQAFQRLARAQERLEAGLRQMRQESKRTQQQQVDTFGDRAVSRLTRYLSGVVSIQTAWSLATQVMREYRAEQERTVREQEQAAPSIGKLSQVADAEHSMKELRRLTDVIFKEGGAATRGGAADVVFQLKSAGLLTGGAIETITQLAQGIDKPEEVITAVKTIIEGRGREETGGFRDVLSKAFAASGKSPSKVTQIALGAADAAGQAKLAGISDEDMLAAMSILATTTGTGAQGGVQLKALLKATTQTGDFGGMSLEQMVRAIAAKNIRPEEMQKYFGRTEAVSGYTSLLESLNTGAFQAARSDVGRAVAEDRTGQAISVLMADPEVRANIALRRSRNQEELSRQSVRATVEETAFQRNLALYRAQPAMRGPTVGPIHRFFIPDAAEPAANRIYQDIKRGLGFTRGLLDGHEDLQQILEAEQRGDEVTGQTSNFPIGTFGADPTSGGDRAAESINRAAQRLEQSARPPQVEGDL